MTDFKLYLLFLLNVSRFMLIYLGIFTNYFVNKRVGSDNFCELGGCL